MFPDQHRGVRFRSNLVNVAVGLAFRMVAEMFVVGRAELP